MLIAILSDIHDNLWNLDTALPAVAHCDAMICCGDLCSPFVIDQLATGFPASIHVVFGNNDADLFRITQKTKRFPNIHLHGEFFEAVFDGKRFAVNHFDTIARPIARAGLYDVVCFGHNHEYEMVRYGPTLALNPGPILGAKFPGGEREDCEPTFIVYNTATGEALGYSFEPGAQGVRGKN